jgi:hypothetical protein
MTFYQVIQTIDLPCVYGVFRKGQTLPYFSYTGAGQDIFYADNTGYHRVNFYQLIYYFKTKDEEAESEIEQTLLDNGYTYDKGSDLYDESEGIYYIIYDNVKTTRKGLLNG